MPDPVGRSRRARVLPLSTLPRRRAAAMVRAPAAFEGSLEQFAARYVLPNLPLPDAVARFNRSLVDYCREQLPLFLVRQVGLTERGRDYLTAEGDRFRATDNAPAWAVHYAVFHDLEVQGEQFARFIDGLPTHMFDAMRAMDSSVHDAGWHIAHIYNVKDGNTDFQHWDRETLTWRFVRNIHPCNYFLVPLVHWQASGGDERVIVYFAHLYAQRYADIWPDFLALARAEPIPYHTLFGQIRLAYGTDEPTSPAVRGSPGPASAKQPAGHGRAVGAEPAPGPGAARKPLTDGQVARKMRTESAWYYTRRMHSDPRGRTPSQMWGEHDAEALRLREEALKLYDAGKLSRSGRPKNADTGGVGVGRIEAPNSPSSAGAQPSVTYHHSRLCFKADQIEPLPMDGSFRVVTKVGTFQMTKAQFYRDFANVVGSRSYRTPGGYHYPTLPARAERHRVH